MAVTKAKLALALYENIGLNKRESKEFIELFFEQIRSALENMETVKLSGFGNFDIRQKTPRPGRNPKTGEEVEISARKVVTFKASPKLKKQVAANTEILLNKNL